jgi:SAM-dependent methyltransferase
MSAPARPEPGCCDPAPSEVGLLSPEILREAVRARYAAAAQAASQGPAVAAATSAGCGCSSAGGCCSPGSTAAPTPSELYSPDEVAQLPAGAVRASLGCGNPTAVSDLRPGEVVLDLGSGGGIDVLLSARRVGPAGFAYGLDMTDEMLELAARNAAQAQATNVKFLKGTIEDVPLPEAAVDVVISNCVINLSADKSRVLREAFRVLRPGGRFAVSDVIVEGELRADLRRDLEMWVGCVAGAIDEAEYRGLLEQAGFEDVEVQVTRDFAAESPELPDALRARAHEAAAGGGGRVVSAFIRARKPAAPSGVA